MIHLIVVAMVLPLVPDRTVQIMSPFLADSREPRSTMATFSFSLATVQVGPVKGAVPKSFPVPDSPAAITMKLERPRPTMVQNFLPGVPALTLGMREETGMREL